MTIGPVVLLGLLSIFFMLTTVRSSMMEEIEEKIGDTQYYQKGENIFEQFLSDEGLAETENKEPDEN